MMLPKLSATLIFSALIMCACYENPVRPEPRMGSELFPNNIGSWWQYEVFDSLTITTSTALVTVLDSTVIQHGDSFTVWSVVFSDRSAPSFTRIANDTITVTLSSFGSRKEQFVLPLTIGSKWNGVLELNDSSEVISVGEVATRAGTFSNVVEISRKWVDGFEGNGARNMTFIAPNVGIVRQVEIVYVNPGSGPFTAVHTLWELLAYDIAPQNKPGTE